MTDDHAPMVPGNPNAGGHNPSLGLGDACSPMNTVKALYPVLKTARLYHCPAWNPSPRR